MHTIFAPVAVIFSALSAYCSTLSGWFGQLISHPLGLFGVAAFVVASLVLAIGCAVWAIAERVRCSAHRARLQTVLRRSQLACQLRDAILGSLPETVVVLRAKEKEPLSYGGGGALLQQCLDGADNAPLATAINDLLGHSAGFSLSVRISGLCHVFVRGVRVGGAAALFLHLQPRVAGTVAPHKKNPGSISTAGVLRLDRASVPPLGGAERLGGTASDVRQPAASRDGEVVIGADGRLKSYNQAFARQWSLRDGELRGEPLWTEIAARCIARDGHNGVWNIVSSAASSTEPERFNDWGAVTRVGGKPLALKISRLKNGATLVKFADAAASSEIFDRTAMAA